MVKIESKKEFQRESLSDDTRVPASTDPYTHPSKDTYISLGVLIFFWNDLDTAVHQHSQFIRRAIRKETSIIIGGEEACSLC